MFRTYPDQRSQLCSKSLVSGSKMALTCTQLLASECSGGGSHFKNSCCFARHQLYTPFAPGNFPQPSVRLKHPLIPGIPYAYHGLDHSQASFPIAAASFTPRASGCVRHRSPQLPRISAVKFGPAIRACTAHRTSSSITECSLEASRRGVTLDTGQMSH